MDIVNKSIKTWNRVSCWFFAENGRGVDWYVVDGGMGEVGVFCGITGHFCEILHSAVTATVLVMCMMCMFLCIR